MVELEAVELEVVDSEAVVFEVEVFEVVPQVSEWEVADQAVCPLVELELQG